MVSDPDVPPELTGLPPQVIPKLAKFAVLPLFCSVRVTEVGWKVQPVFEGVIVKEALPSPPKLKPPLALVVVVPVEPPLIATVAPWSALVVPSTIVPVIVNGGAAACEIHAVSSLPSLPPHPDDKMASKQAIPRITKCADTAFD